MILEIIKCSGLNNFFYTRDDLVLWVIENEKYVVIQLNLKIKEISYIKENFEDFIKILEKIIFTFNQTSNKKFKNITFNNIKDKWKIYNNCIFLYNSSNWESWYRTTKNTIEIYSPKAENRQRNLYEKVLNLIISKDISVRNLIKLWIIQIRARELYNFLKEKSIFEISKYNNNHKIYYLDNLKLISKKELESLIYT